MTLALEHRTAEAAQEYRAALASAHEARTQLVEALSNARTGGAKIRELMEWTGYSRRRIFQLLEDERKRS